LVVEADMKKLVAISLAVLTAGCAAQEPMEMTAEAQTQLAEELRGRSAGAPVNCVSQRLLRGNRSVGESAIIFEGPGSVIYVNRPAAGCPDLEPGRALITRKPSTQLCAGDIATVFDPVTRFEYGSCGLGEFTPYRRTG
jgi:hypothetical protein